MKVFDTQGREFHMFPMQKFNTRFRDYYMDNSGDIFSTRGNGKLKQLMGSKPYGQTLRYFTLDGGSFQENYLRSNCTTHKDFVMETSTPTVQGVKTAPMLPSKVLNALAASTGKLTAERSHATSVTEALSTNGTLIASVVDNKFVFGSNPVIHTTDESVKSEMVRLANLNPGTRYVAFKIAGSVVAGGVVWS